MKKRELLTEKCRLLMADGGWWSIPTMAAALGCSETGASARIRDMRKERYGGHKVIKRPVGHQFEYRLIAEKEAVHAFA